MSSNKHIRRGSKFAAILMALTLSVCMVLSAAIQTSAVTTADAKVDDVKKSILQVVMTYQADNSDKVVWSSGTCFLINPTTAISCAHIFDPSINDELRRLLVEAYGPTHQFDTKYVKNYQILVNGGVPVNASLRKINKTADYSVIKLDETVARPTVKLGNSKDLKITQQIYTLGFPSTVADLQDSRTYTTDQVTITGSSISNISTTGGVDYITHNANISNGNSGGPLVDENGLVVGINLYKTEDDYFLATAIDQVAALLDDLDIDYDRQNAPAPQPTTREESSQAQVETTVKPTIADPTPATEPSAIGKTGTEGGDMMKTIIIIAIVVLAVVVIGVVIIIIVLNSKKKKAPVKQQIGPTVMPGPVNMTPGGMGVQQRSTYQGQTYRPDPTIPTNEGAGETSVLNDGAGETTVLGNQMSGALLRKRNNERISINKPEFIIGKERRRVDYCISDNNSVSRQHAKIRVRSGRCYIADLGSTNCTFVNGVKLSPNQEVILSKGDKIKISDEEFEFIG